MCLLSLIRSPNIHSVSRVTNRILNIETCYKNNIKTIDISLSCFGTYTIWHA